MMEIFGDFLHCMCSKLPDYLWVDLSGNIYT